MLLQEITTKTLTPASTGNAPVDHTRAFKEMIGKSSVSHDWFGRKVLQIHEQGDKNKFVDRGNLYTVISNIVKLIETLKKQKITKNQKNKLVKSVVILEEKCQKTPFSFNPLALIRKLFCAIFYPNWEATQLATARDTLESIDALST